jgi:hypothetical protein
LTSPNANSPPSVCTMDLVRPTTEVVSESLVSVHMYVAQFSSSADAHDAMKHACALQLASRVRGRVEDGVESPVARKTRVGRCVCRSSASSVSRPVSPGQCSKPSRGWAQVRRRAHEEGGAIEAGEVE